MSKSILCLQCGKVTLYGVAIERDMCSRCMFERIVELERYKECAIAQIDAMTELAIKLEKQLAEAMNCDTFNLNNPNLQTLLVTAMAQEEERCIAIYDAVAEEQIKKGQAHSPCYEIKRRIKARNDE